jgi:cell division protein FtsI (penicillin-binding protein 3)
MHSWTDEPHEIENSAPRERVIVSEGAWKERLEKGRKRLALIIVCFAVGFVCLALRLTALALFTDCDTRTAKHVVENADVDRVTIVDRSGQTLATDLRLASLYANPDDVWDADETTHRLVKLFPDLDPKTVKARLSSKKKFEWIKRDLSPRQQQEAFALGLPGLGFRAKAHRVYPAGRTLAHVLGFVDTENLGIAGLEKGLDGRIRDVAAGPLALSIDLSAQHAMRDELVGAVERFHALGAAGIVLDAATGEVIALVSLPDFDPNDPPSPKSAALFNRVTKGVYEMGSTMKTVTTAMALDSGKVRLSDSFDATKPIRAGRYVINDYHPENRWLSVSEIFLHSSNIGSARMALDVGTDVQRAFLGRLGLTKPPKIELPEVGSPLLPQQWHDLETMTVAFGHGIAVSPLQVAVATAMLVNGGRQVEPTLVKNAAGEPSVGEAVVSPETSRIMRELLRKVVTEGTGKLADVPGYAVGGKTGTAEKAVAHGYAHHALISSFLAAFPASRPRYVVLVLLDEPKGTAETYGFATAGYTAAPTAAKVIERIAPILRVAPVTEGRTVVASN